MKLHTHNCKTAILLAVCISYGILHVPRGPHDWASTTNSEKHNTSYSRTCTSTRTSLSYRSCLSVPFVPHTSPHPRQACSMYLHLGRGRLHGLFTHRRNHVNPGFAHDEKPSPKCHIGRQLKAGERLIPVYAVNGLAH
jgi:hypothetical protein